MNRFVTLLGSALVVVACSPAPEIASPAVEGALTPAPVTPTAGASAASLDTDVETLLKVLGHDRVRVMRELSQPEYQLGRRLMTLSGMDDELGGAAAADAALRAFMIRHREVLTAELDAQARPMAGTNLADGVTGIIGGNVQLAGALRFVEKLYGDGSAKTMPTKTDQNVTSISIKDGNITFDSTTRFTEAGISGEFLTHMKVNACPDAKGEVVADVAQSSSLSAKGRGARASAKIRIFRTVTDDAVYDALDSDARLETVTFGPKAGSFVDVTMRRNDSTSVTGDVVVNRRSSHATDHDADLATTLVRALELYALSYIFKAREVWESGACVKLEPTTSPAKRSGVKPSTSFSVQAAPRSRIDGTPTGGTVLARLTGASSIEPANTKVRADATFTYVAPGEKEKDASVYFESRSKRGIGKSTVPFDTRESQAYTVEGGADEFHGTGLACGLQSPFTVQGSGVTVTFTPSGSSGGTYSYSGSMSSFAVWGNGTYTVNYQDEKAVSLQATGPGSVKTPKGTFTRNGSETYTLTPATAGCDS